MTDPEKVPNSKRRATNADPGLEDWGTADSQLDDSDALEDAWFIKEGQVSVLSGVDDVLRPCFEVTSNVLNFRKVPSANGNKPLGSLRRGDQVVVIEEQGEWFKIENPESLLLAPVYVNKKYLRPSPQDKLKKSK